MIVGIPGMWELLYSPWQTHSLHFLSFFLGWKSWKKNVFFVSSLRLEPSSIILDFAFFRYLIVWNLPPGILVMGIPRTWGLVGCFQNHEPQRTPDQFWGLFLRWVWVFLERTWILSGIQFTAHFIEIFVVETKRFVGRFVHVILTRQTCGQRSSKAAESKRWALGNYFSERICCMFLMSKCRGDSDLGLCTTSGLALEEP